MRNINNSIIWYTCTCTFKEVDSRCMAYLIVLRNSNLICFDIIEVEASLQLEWETQIVEHTIYIYIYIYGCRCNVHMSWGTLFHIWGLICIILCADANVRLFYLQLVWIELNVHEQWQKQQTSIYIDVCLLLYFIHDSKYNFMLCYVMLCKYVYSCHL